MKSEGAFCARGIAAKGKAIRHATRERKGDTGPEAMVESWNPLRLARPRPPTNA